VKIAKNKNFIPKLRHHKPTGQAYVVLNNQTIWLGKYDNENIQQDYNKTIAEWLSNGKQLAVEGTGISINEIISRFWIYAEGYYRNPDGTPTSELDSLRYAMRPLVELYGHTEAAAFGPRCLRAVQKNMVDLGWCRNNVNRSLSRVKMLFKWAVSQELLPGSVYQALITVQGLRKGRSDARETSPKNQTLSFSFYGTIAFVERFMTMAINWKNEEIITLREAADRLSKLSHKKVHVSTVWRWCRNGFRGIHLEFINIGVQTFTSVEGMQRFFIALTQLNNETQQTFGSKRPKIKKAKRALQNQREIDSARAILIRAKILQDNAIRRRRCNAKNRRCYNSNC
jgi:hypothetical protein